MWRVPSFDWYDIYARRSVLAAGIQRRLDLSFSFQIKEPFSALSLTDQNLADQPMWRVPFLVIAQRMIVAATPHHVIDHAWWLIARDRTNEPWGFVTEPYIEPDKAEQLAHSMKKQHEDWGIETWVLPQAQSAWFPGSTVPIVIAATVGCLPQFLRLGVGAALEYMS